MKALSLSHSRSLFKKNSTGIFLHWPALMQFNEFSLYAYSMTTGAMAPFLISVLVFQVSLVTRQGNTVMSCNSSRGRGNAQAEAVWHSTCGLSTKTSESQYQWGAGDCSPGQKIARCV